MKKNTIIKSRLNSIMKIFLVILVVIVGKILYMTTIQYSYYSDLANQKTFKRILVQAPRGEIRDRNGVLLAGNEPQFIVQIVGDSFNKAGSEDKNQANRIAHSIIKILEKNNEKYIDEFPIIIEDGKYYFTYDKKIEIFKRENGIPMEYNPKQCFYYVVDSLIKNDVLSLSDRNLEPIDLQTKINSLGYYPPILVSKWQFTQEKEKNDWLESYKLKNNSDGKIDAEKAFRKIREDYYKIDKSMSDSQARKIMLVRDMIKSKIYTQYSPVVLAKGIKKETVSQIEENSMNLSGISVSLEQKRVYPYENLASHILGYVGKIPSSKLETLGSDGYKNDDIIGLSGIERSLEKNLKGEHGYKEVKVDSVGRVIEEMKSIVPTSGDDVFLTIDSKLQNVAEKSLEAAIKSARTGSTFNSKYGNINIKEHAPRARSGAIVAIDVNSGDVLAMSSFPNYNPNKFAEGISSEEYSSYLPKNENDLLAPNPLLNLATQGAFQPGSTFKLITAMAALESGLSPNYTINDPGVIKLGNRNFADYIWHHGRKNHGVENLYKAIQESCNIYFYVIGSDKNWMTGQDLNLGMGAKKILEYAKKFGLDGDTGLENQIETRNGKVPSEEQKIEKTKIQLKIALDRTMRLHFEGIDYNKNRDKFESKVDEIVSWIDEKEIPGRSETMTRLRKLGVKEQYVQSDTDYIVFSYFNFAKWRVGDTFNLAIGQGENVYNPSQIARYTAAIANGGHLVNLNVVRSAEDVEGNITVKPERKFEKINFKNDANLKDLKVGMVRVSEIGLAKDMFANFPINVASKTGTAEKNGKIPSNNEFEYLKSHLSEYGVDRKVVFERYEQLKSEKELELTNQKIKKLKEKIDDPKTSSEESKELKAQLDRGVKVKLEKTDKVESFYLRKAIKQLNDKITDKDIDRFKADYGSFAWCIAYAPANNPKIAVACVIPQGETSSYAVLPIREVMGQYFGLNDEKLPPNIYEKLDKEKSGNKEKDDNKDNDKEKGKIE